MDMLAAPVTGVEWDHLVDAGILDGPVELVGGRKVVQVTEGPAHAAMVRRLRRALAPVLPEGTELSEAHPLALTSVDRPEPDLAVIDTDPSDWADGHPPASACHLVIEVSDASRRLDLGPKAQRYAVAGVPAYWVVDLVDAVVVVHADARDGTWSTVSAVPFGEPVSAPSLTGAVSLAT